MAKPRVLVTRRWPQAVEAKMAEVFDLELNRADTPLGVSELKDALGQYDAVLLKINPYALRRLSR